MVKKILLAVLLLFAIAVVLAFTMDFDSPELGRKALARASAATGIQLSASSFRLNLMNGLELGDVTATSAFPGGSYQAELGSLVFEHRLVPLLWGILAVERIVIERPRVVLVRGEEPPLSSPESPRRRPEPEAAGPDPDDAGEDVATAETEGGLALEVHQILLVDGAVLVRHAGTEAEGISLEGLGLTLGDLRFRTGALTPLHALAARGSVAFAALRLDGTNVERARGELAMEGGRFSMNDLAFVTEQGSFQGTVTLDFTSVPFRHEIALAGDPLDVNRIAGASDGGFGPGTLELEARGFGTDSKNVEGRGTLHLVEGRLPSTEALKQVEAMLGRTDLVGSPYAATKAPFRIENNHVLLETFRLDTPQAGLDLEGSVDLDGPLDLRLTLRTPREGLSIKEVPNELLDALTDDEGFVALPFRIEGTIPEPRVRLDSRTLMAEARRGAQNVIQEKALEGLKSLFDRKKKE